MNNETKYMSGSLFRSKLFLMVETFYLIIFPLLLIYWKPELIHWRLPVMLTSLIYVFLVMKTTKLSLRNIGLTKTNFLPAIKDLIPFTLIGIASLIIGKSFDSSIWYVKAIVDEVSGNPVLLAVFIYAVVSAPLQELIFREFYLSRLELVSRNKTFLIWYSAIVFAVIHLSLGNWRITIASLLMGLAYAGNFLKYRNLLAISISHAILGSLMIYLMTF